jgi:hypothetical protein
MGGLECNRGFEILGHCMDCFVTLAMTGDGWFDLPITKINIGKSRVGVIMVNMDVYDTWKTLRNFLRKLDINDSLSVIRYYSVRKFLDKKPLVPADLELHQGADDDRFFLPWDLETLAREVLYVCDTSVLAKNSLKRSKAIESVMNKLKEIEYVIQDKYICKK